MIHNIGLVLEGGGMRGVFTAGLLDALLVHGLRFAHVTGVSAGACNAASYVSGQMGRNMAIYDRYVDDRRYLNKWGLLTPSRSIFQMDFIFDRIPNALIPYDYAAYAASGHRLLVGTTDVATGQPVYFDSPKGQALNLCCRASSSIPLFSPVVTVDGGQYLDGGTSDPIPFARALADCARVVVVTTRPAQYRKKPLPMQGMYKHALRKHPQMLDCCARRHQVYNAQLCALAQMEEAGTAFVIRPDALAVDTFSTDREAIWRAYVQGEQALQAALPALLRFIAQ